MGCEIYELFDDDYPCVYPSELKSHGIENSLSEKILAYLHKHDGEVNLKQLYSYTHLNKKTLNKALSPLIMQKIVYITTKWSDKTHRTSVWVNTKVPHIRFTSYTPQYED